jgi:hypothetical protein
MPGTKLQIDQNLCLDEFSRCRQILGYLLETAAEVDAVFLDRLVGNFNVGADDEFQRGGIATGILCYTLDFIEYRSDAAQRNADRKSTVGLGSNAL